jgi:hypothetical protein
MMVWDSRLLRKMLGCKRDEEVVRGSIRIASPSVVWLIKTRRRRWVRYVLRTEER